MKFRTPLNHSMRACCPVGKETRDEFQLKIEPDGSRRLIKTGVRNAYEEIQSFKEECDINRIVKRAMGGDLSALNQTEGAYIDATVLPRDLHEAHAVLHDAEAAYLSIPERERLQIGSFGDFLAQFSSIDKINELVARFDKSLDANVGGDEHEA